MVGIEVTATAGDAAARGMTVTATVIAGALRVATATAVAGTTATVVVGDETETATTAVRHLVSGADVMGAGPAAGIDLRVISTTADLTARLPKRCRRTRRRAIRRNAGGAVTKVTS